MAGVVAQAQRVVVIPAFYTQSENNIHHGDTEKNKIFIPQIGGEIG